MGVSFRTFGIFFQVLIFNNLLVLKSAFFKKCEYVGAIMAHSLRPTCSFGTCDNSACAELIPFREVTLVINGGKTTLVGVGRCGGWWRGDVQLLKVDNNFQSLVPREIPYGYQSQPCGFS